MPNRCRYSLKAPCPVSACERWSVTGVPAGLLTHRPTDGSTRLVQDAVAVYSDHVVCHLSTVTCLAALVSAKELDSGFASFAWVISSLSLAYRSPRGMPARRREAAADTVR